MVTGATRREGFNVFDIQKQMDEWIANKTLIALTIVGPTTGRKYAYGKILKFQPSDNLLIFYDDDLKQVRNISLLEIEDLQPSTTPQSTNPKVKSPSKVLESLTSHVKAQQEAIQVIRELPPEELSALLPLLKVLAKKSSGKKNSR